jgi:hypothetical protein
LKKSLLAGAYLMSLTGSAYATNASIQCEFALLNQARETLIFCGEKIDPAGERRYDELTKEFQAFIASNADSRTGWQTVEDIRRTLLQEGKERVCKDPDYQALRRAFFVYVSDSGMAQAKKLLSRPRDPSEGDCF